MNDELLQAAVNELDAIMEKRQAVTIIMFDDSGKKLKLKQKLVSGVFKGFTTVYASVVKLLGVNMNQDEVTVKVLYHPDLPLLVKTLKDRIEARKSFFNIEVREAGSRDALMLIKNDGTKLFGDDDDDDDGALYDF